MTTAAAVFRGKGSYLVCRITEGTAFTRRGDFELAVASISIETSGNTVLADKDKVLSFNCDICRSPMPPSDGVSEEMIPTAAPLAVFRIPGNRTSFVYTVRYIKV